MVKRCLVTQYKKAKWTLSTLIDFHANRDSYYDKISYQAWPPIYIKIDRLTVAYKPKGTEYLSQKEIQECCCIEIQNYILAPNKYEETYHFFLPYLHSKYSINNLLRSLDLSNVDILLYEYIPLVLKHVSCHTIRICNENECFDIISMMGNVSNIQVCMSHLQKAENIHYILNGLIQIVEVKKISISYQISDSIKNIDKLLELYDANIKSAISNGRYKNVILY